MDEWVQKKQQDFQTIEKENAKIIGQLHKLENTIATLSEKVKQMPPTNNIVTCTQSQRRSTEFEVSVGQSVAIPLNTIPKNATEILVYVFMSSGDVGGADCQINFESFDGEKKLRFPVRCGGDRHMSNTDTMWIRINDRKVMANFVCGAPNARGTGEISAYRI